MDSRFSNSLTEGDFNSGFLLRQSLVEGDFWALTQGCYTIHRGQNHIDNADYKNILATSFGKGRFTLPAHICHENDHDYFYAVRCVSCTGKQEQGTTAVIRLSLDAQGKQRPDRPNSVRNLRAEVVGGGRIRISWWYGPLGQQAKPAYFSVFGDNGSGTINFFNVLATVEYGGSNFYSFLSSPGSDGQLYLFSVRAVTSSGVDDGNTAFVCATVDLTGPSAVAGVHGRVGF